MTKRPKLLQERHINVNKFISANIFELQQHATVSGHLTHAMCLWWWWLISQVIVYLRFNICSCRLQPESELLV